MGNSNVYCRVCKTSGNYPSTLQSERAIVISHFDCSHGMCLKIFPGCFFSFLFFVSIPCVLTPGGECIDDNRRVFVVY